jgi:hypothetical protein
VVVIQEIQDRPGGLAHRSRSRTAVALRPVDALDAWLGAAVITAGPIFVSIDKGGRVGRKPLSCKAIGRIVKRSAFYRRPTTQRSISTTAPAHTAMSAGTAAASARPPPSSAGPIGVMGTLS